MTPRGGLALAGEATVLDTIRADEVRWRLLGHVRALGLPDCWIGAGFVRDAVWDRLHGRPPSSLVGDVDVVWFGPATPDVEVDREYEAILRAREPRIAWSVKNQARMHERNGDPSYASLIDAMRHWPETATAVAIRRTPSDDCELAAPFGTNDLLDLVLRPTPAFAEAKRPIYADRVRTKRWASIWPLLEQADT